MANVASLSTKQCKKLGRDFLQGLLVTGQGIMALD